MEPLTNYAKWRAYTDGLSSPDNFIDWSWIFTIAAALERRVGYNGDPKYDDHTIYPNMYVIFVGKAGVGKGIAINPATGLLKHHLRKDFKLSSPTSTDQEKVILDSIEKSNLDASEESTLQMKKGGEKVDPPLFPYAPDATTYEKLVEDMANSGRRINFMHRNSDGQEKLDIYFHCSMFFSLPELGSLLRKRTEDTLNFILGLYDCPKDYEYKTVTRKSDRVRRGCLNILAGTTPEFIEGIFNQKLIDQGFSSRTFFIFAPKNRKNVFTPKAFTPEQKQYRLDLLAHIKKLAGLYGQVQVTQETKDFLEKWWDNVETNRQLRSNTSPKMEPYYGRKNIHVVKVALAKHFSESTDMFVPIERFEEAIEFLEKEEKNMHNALTFESDNPLSKATDKILDYINHRKSANMVDLMTTFWKNLPNGKTSMEEILRYLTGTGEIKEEPVSNEITGKVTINYRSKIYDPK